MRMKTIGIIQSNYIPWKGYFDFINRVDEFILFDDMQFTKRDWRNRNIIKTQNGLHWLSIPVQTKGKYLQKISDTEVLDHSWAEKHWKTILHSYSSAPFFNAYKEFARSLYERAAIFERISDINFLFINEICKLLNISTRITWSSDYPSAEGTTERLVQLCLAAGGNRYLSGPKAREYMETQLFAQSGIELAYIDYNHYPTYQQLHGEFTHGVSVLDPIFSIGADALSTSLKRIAFDHPAFISARRDYFELSGPS